MTTGIVFDVKRFSIHDGPGIRTTVFLKGCPLSCSWCHNPEGQAPGQELVLRPDRCIGCGTCVEVCERGAILWEEDAVVTQRERCQACGTCVEVCYAEARELVGRPMSVTEVLAEIERDSVFYDESGGGVTFSGGEPLSQAAFLRGILAAAKGAGLHTALDTCGFASWDVLESLRAHVDLFLYDLKLMDDVRHRESTGVSNELILENLLRLSQAGHRVILRVPVVPGVNDDEENLRRVGAFAADLPAVERLDLLPYHRIGRDKYRRLARPCSMPQVDPPSDAEMLEIAGMLRQFDLPIART